jgi:tetratricopeptide (TPR) repeat protein
MVSFLKSKLACFCAALGLAGLTLLTYYRSLSYGFMFDDAPTIDQNILLRIHSFKQMFLHNQRWLSTMFNKWTFVHWGSDAHVFRLQALMLHITLGLLVFYACYKLFSVQKKQSFASEHALWASALASAFFLLHPVQSLTASYIAQMRQEGLVLLFIMLGVIALFHATQARSTLQRLCWYSFLFLCAGLGAGAKEIIVVMPVLLLLVDWFFLAQGNRSELARRLPIHLVCMGIIFGFYVYIKQQVLFSQVATLQYTVSNNRGNILTPLPGQAIHPLAYAMSQFQVIVHYITMFFWPFSICFDYSYKILDSFFHVQVLLPLMLLLGLLGLNGVLLRKDSTHIVAFCSMWFLCAVLPRASVVPSMEFTCDYRTYIASVGMHIFLAYGVMRFVLWASRLSEVPLFFRRYGQVLFVAVLIPGMCMQTREQTKIWCSLVDMWEDVVRKNPTKPRAWNNYAVGLSQRHRYDEAIIAFNKAIECDPTYAEPVINLAYHYQQFGKSDLAMELYGKAINMAEVHPEMYNNVGYLHLSEGRYYNAEESFKVAIHYRPHYTVARIGFAKTYIAQNKFKDALDVLKAGIELDGSDVDLRYTYATVFMNLKEYEKALHEFAALSVDYTDVAFQVGSCYYQLQKYGDAAQYFARAYSKDSASWNNAYNLAMSYLNTQRYKEALPLFEQCKVVQDQIPYVMLHVVRCHKELGEKDEMQRAFAELTQKCAYKDIILEAKALLKT